MLARHGHDLSLVVPWCSLTEAKGTLDRIIREDLGFPEIAGRFLGRWRQANHPLAEEVSPNVQRFINAVREERKAALSGYVTDLNRLASTLEILDPSPRAAEMARWKRPAERWVCSTGPAS